MATFLKPTVSLFAHQQHGIAWMKEREMRGFILADQMGLGKTLQSLALINPTTEQFPTLVVVPKSVITQWKNEVKNKTILTPFIYKPKSSLPLNVNVVITTYHTATYDEYLKTRQFSRIILDEGHQLRNMTQRFQGIMDLKAERKVILTGTPVVNKKEDLFALCCFLGIYTYKQKSSSYEKTKQKNMFLRDVCKKQFIDNLILRRTLADNPEIQLPSKNEERIFITMEKEEMFRYNQLLNLSRKNALDWMTTGHFSEMLTLLLRLRQASCDLRLVGDLPHGMKMGSKMKETIYRIQMMHRRKEKVVVFTNFKDVAHLLHSHLRHENIRSLIFTGDLSTNEREKTLSDFKESAVDVLIMTTGAGAVGLNLTEANNVIIYDFHWSLATDLQAIGRVYRIGQTKTVNVIRMVNKGTIDERILKLQSKKKQIIGDVLRDSSSVGSSAGITREDMQELIFG